MDEFSIWNQFGGWDPVLPLYVDEVVTRWWRILSSEAPWAGMIADDRLGSMRSVVAELVNEAREPDDHDRLRRLAGAALEHGTFRARQAWRRSDVICEFGILLDALDASLRQLLASPTLVRDALASLDPEVELAQHWALKGWHRGLTERPSRHALAVKELLDEVR